MTTPTPEAPVPEPAPRPPSEAACALAEALVAALPATAAPVAAAVRMIDRLTAAGWSLDTFPPCVCGDLGSGVPGVIWPAQQDDCCGNGPGDGPDPDTAEVHGAFVMRCDSCQRYPDDAAAAAAVVAASGGGKIAGFMYCLYYDGTRHHYVIPTDEAVITRAAIDRAVDEVAGRAAVAAAGRAALAREVRA